MIPDRYPLIVMAGAGDRQRTLKNVQDSEGTAVVFSHTLSGGTKRTRDFCKSSETVLFGRCLSGPQVPLTDAINGVVRFF